MRCLSWPPAPPGGSAYRGLYIVVTYTNDGPAWEGLWAQAGWQRWLGISRHTTRHSEVVGSLCVVFLLREEWRERSMTGMI